MGRSIREKMAREANLLVFAGESIVKANCEEITDDFIHCR